MKKYLLILLLALAPLIYAACAAPAPPAAVAPIPETKVKDVKGEPWQARWDKVVEGAKKEREIMIFGTIGAGTVTQLTNAIKDKYGIQLNFVTMQRGNEMTERIVREKRAGIQTVDVIIVGATTLVSGMKPLDLLDPIAPVLILPEAVDPKAWRGGTPFLDKDRKIVSLIASYLRHVTRNTTLVKEGEIKNYKDLINPKWKGKIILNDPTTAGAGNSWVSLLVDRWGLEVARDYLKEFAKLEPVITRDGRLQVETLAHGKYAIGVATRVEVTGEFLALGAPIAPVRTEEGGTITGSGGVLALPTNSPHPNGAALMVNWLMTKEGQTIFSSGFGSPGSRLDVLPPPGFNPALLPEPGEPLQIEDEEGLKVKGSLLLDMAKEVFAPLFR